MTTSSRQRTVLAPDGCRLAVTEVGDAAAPAVVLAHGAGSSARFVVASFTAALVDSGRRLVAYDLRGHGASSVARSVDAHHLDVHAADLAVVAASTAGVVEVVGGVSLGAHAAVRALTSGRFLLQPDALLACLPAWVGGGVPGAGPHAAVAAEVRRLGVDAVLARLRDDRSLPAWLRDTLVADYARHDRESLAAVLLALDGAAGPDEDELRAVDVPLAVVGWDGDPGHPAAVADRWAVLAPRGVRGELAFAAMERTGVHALGATAGTTLAQALGSQRGP